jgi:hypothetical protein
MAPTTTCPHNCNHCRALEAGKTGPFTPKEFMELFEVIEPKRERAPLSADTKAAKAALDAAQAAYDKADRAVAKVIAERPPVEEVARDANLTPVEPDPALFQFENRLEEAAEQRQLASDALGEANGTYEQSLRRDQEAWRQKSREAELLAQKAEQEKRQKGRRSRIASWILPQVAR